MQDVVSVETKRGQQRDKFYDFTHNLQKYFSINCYLKFHKFANVKFLVSSQISLCFARSSQTHTFVPSELGF